jgi:hypothetical protein
VTAAKNGLVPYGWYTDLNKLVEIFNGSTAYFTSLSAGSSSYGATIGSSGLSVNSDTEKS